MKNIARDNKQAEILFKEKQQTLYNNVRDVFPTEKLETFIQDQSIISRDVKNNMETAKQRLRQVATNDEVVDFILERLSEDELNYLLVNFNKVMTKLKKTNTKLDKELFIQFIRKEALDNPVTLGNVNMDENIERRPDEPPIQPTERSPSMRFFDVNDFESNQGAEVENIRTEQQSLREELNEL